MKLIMLTVLLTLNFFIGKAQEPVKPNAAYIELGGNGLLLSLNYDRKFTKVPMLRAHIGAGIYGGDKTFLTLPFGLNYLLRLKKSMGFAEFGLGITYTMADVRLYEIIDTRPGYIIKKDYFNVIPSIGYRSYSKKNILLRFGFTPVINQYGFLPLIGFSVGKAF